MRSRRVSASRTWRQLDERAARLAAFLAGQGVGTADRVAIALFNGIEYVESVLAALKLRAVPVNVNYRYQAGEMRHVFEDARVSGVVYDASLRSRVLTATRGTPGARTLAEVGGAAGAPAVEGVHRYETVIEEASPLRRRERRACTRRSVRSWLAGGSCS